MTFSLTTIAIFFAISFMGCPKKTTFPQCKNNEDCRIDALGEPMNGVCYMGKCEECVSNTDCLDLKQCVDHRCLSACETDADCPNAHHCEDNFCRADCVDDSSCPNGKGCVLGRCVASRDTSEDSEVLALSGCGNVKNIHFDFDKYTINDEFLPYLENLANCLNSDPTKTVTIEGHTDDRGTPSYNMALGERRANAVKSFLIGAKGIAAYRIKMVSYGEQKPLESGHDEFAWAKNRRAEFVLENN